MKQLLLFILALSLLQTTVAAPVKYKLLKNTNNWTATSNWTPTGTPKNGDTILIPSGLQLVLGADITLNDIYVDLYGSILLSGNNMKAKFTGKSMINIHTGATLYGSKNSQQVELGNIIYKGNQPVITGPMLATAISTGFKPYIEFSVLPVKFTSFTVIRSNAAVLVQWTTTEEVNASHYIVERSRDGAAWSSIATLRAAGKPANTYAYADRSSATGTIRYRIKQLDADGTFSITEVRTVRNDVATTPVIFAAQRSITVQFAQPAKGHVKVEVIGLNGNVALTQTLSEPAGNVQLATGLKGIYVVRVSNGKDLSTAKQIIL
jgi:hypothetical protein